MSSYLYGMHDQITKGYAPLKATKGGPHFLDSQGLNPEGLGGEGSPSMSEDVLPASKASYVMDTSTLEGQGTYGGKVKESKAGTLGDPRRVAESSTQAFSAGVRDRFHLLKAKPRLTRHPLNANVRQLDTAAERYIAAPQYEDPVQRANNDELQARVMSRSDTVIETPEPNNAPVHIGVLMNKAITQAQIDAIRAANAVSLRTLNVARQAAVLAQKATPIAPARQTMPPVAREALPEESSNTKMIMVALGAVALLGAFVWVTTKVA